MSTSSSTTAAGSGIQKTGSNGAISRPQTVAAGRLQGAESQDFVLPRVHIYQGLPSEAKLYGKGFAPGDLINVVTNEKIVSTRFVPILGYKQWIKWKEPRGSGVEYNFREKSQVPAEDLTWEGDQAPTAQEYINYVVLFEDMQSPVILSFTKTGLNAGRAINTCESMRRNKAPGLYSIELQEKSNDKGAWLSPRVRPAGDPPANMAELAAMFFESMSGQEVKTSDPEFDPDAQ
jgi:hypothetical protein